MPSNTINALLDRLEELKRSFKDNQRLGRLLSELDRRRFKDASSLIRFHEILLFIRAYPPNPAILRKTESLLDSFHRRVEQYLRTDAEDLSDLVQPEVSGIAGTTFSAIWGYDTVRYLARRYPSRVEIDWEDYENPALVVNLLKDFLPLFEDGSYVEYPVPYLKWLRAAKAPGERDLQWLLRHFERLPLPDKTRSDLFEGLKLWVRWELGTTRATRTRLRRRARKIFYHDGPLLGRRDVSLAQEIEDVSPLPFKKISRAEGEKILALGRDTMTVRYRELHGYTYGDARHVLRVEAGRGVEFFIWGVPAARRLPLLGYHGVLIFKNGVPLGYAESLALFERTEFGLNLFYTFREGESAWIYARLLRAFRQLFGLAVVSVDPYQIGFNNEEGIESGAFWFYRKMGFRPVVRELARLVASEERKIGARQGYRTTPRVLRRIATGHLLYEAPGTRHPGQWDGFHMRNIGLAVERRMVERFQADERKIRQASIAGVARALDIQAPDLNEAEQRAFNNFALALALIPDLSRWSEDEREALVRIVRAKAGADESVYIRLMQKHARLRSEFIKLGST